MKSTVLVIEDNPVASKALDYILKEDYEVVIFKNGLDALEWIKEGNIPSLIIADLNLPVMSGYEFVAKIKSHKKYSKIPLIIVSSEADERIIEKCYKAGVFKYFVKPADPNELYTTVKNLDDGFQLVAC